MKPVAGVAAELAAVEPDDAAAGAAVLPLLPMNIAIGQPAPSLPEIGHFCPPPSSLQARQHKQRAQRMMELAMKRRIVSLKALETKDFCRSRT